MNLYFSKTTVAALGPVGGIVAALALFVFGTGCGRSSETPVAISETEPSPQPISRSPAQTTSSERPAPETPAINSIEQDEPALSAKVESKLPIYEIVMKPDDLAALEANPYGEELYPATFIADGTTYENVKIRHRGAWARSWPKKPLKLFFNDDKLFEGMHRLNLNSSFRDPSFLRETLAYHIYQVAGAPASKSRLVRVHLNGKFRGLYVQVEQPDKAFLKRINLKGATILKASSRMKQGDERVQTSTDAYRLHYEQETQKGEADGFVTLQAFCQELAQTRDALALFEKNVDLDKYINYLAASALCQNWDGYSKNHFLVYDGRGSKKWFVLPWDLDRALGDHWDWSFGRADLPIDLGTRQRPGVTGWNRMMDRFFSHPELRRRLADRLQQLLETEFTVEKLEPVIDQMHAAIQVEAELDYRRWPNRHSTMMWRDDQVGVDRSIQAVKTFVKDRREFLLKEVGKLRTN